MATMVAPPNRNSSRSCPARFATPRRPDRPTFGGELAAVAEKLGTPFMPWQRLVADVGGEYDPDTGVPYYREVVVTVPRQQGKTLLFLAWQINRCVSKRWSHPQRSAFTAQTGKDARDKWIDELFPLIRHSDLVPLVARRGDRLKINEGMGNESIHFKTGSLIRLLSTSASSGHSKTLDQAVMDEIWHDTDDRRQQGLRPAMLTRPDAQLLVCSTAGTQASTLYNQKVDIGRKAVAGDSGRGVAYFEWAADDDWDPYDDESYFEFMPALCPDPPCSCGDGWRHTITLDVVRSERASLDEGEFRRAYGNRPSMTNDRLIPVAAWDAVQSQDAPSGEVRFGLDVSEDRSRASIVAYGGGVVELVECRAGTGWVADRCNDLDGPVALDFKGPAGVLADQIDRCERMSGPDVVQACGSMFDAIVNGDVRFRSHPDFDEAVEGAVKKSVGDQWVWSRKGSLTDVTPLMAASLARAAAGDDVTEPFVAWV